MFFGYGVKYPSLYLSTTMSEIAAESLFNTIIFSKWPSPYLAHADPLRGIFYEVIV